MNIFQNYCLLSFTIAFVSWCLSSILLGIKQVFQRMDLNQHIKSHDWPWSSTVWLLCGSSFVSSFFLKWHVYKILSPFLYYSLCLLLCSTMFSSPGILSLIDKMLLWDFHGISITVNNSKKFLWCFYDICMGFQKGAHGIARISIGFPLGSFVISIGFPWESCAISMIFLLDFYEISAEFLWDLNRVSMVFPWDSSGISIGCAWGFCGIPMGFLWDLYDIPGRFL